MILPQEHLLKVNLFKINLISNGIFVTLKHVCIFSLGTMHQNSKHGCSRCTTVGEFNHTSGTVVFKQLDAPLRTDLDFRNNLYLGAHQREITPLVAISYIDMISDFVVGDSLHLLDYGITKTMLIGFMDGKLDNVDAKWSAHQATLVSQYLASIRAPYEITAQRPIRDLSVIAKWKGIEFQNFALYTGIVVLNGNLPDYIYKHFLLYFCSMTIYSSKYHLTSLNIVADTCVKLFVERFKVIYGSQHFTSNLHNLIHLIDDVKRFGPINTFSAYPFESFLFQIKKLLRSGYLPLAQAAERLLEDENVTQDHKIIPQNPLIPTLIKPSSLKVEHLNKIIPVKYDLYTVVGFSKFKINTNNDEDRWLFTTNNNIVEVLYFVSFDGNLKMYGRSVKDIGNYFDLPIASSRMFIFSSKNLIMNPPNLFEISHIKCKLFKIKRDTKLMHYEKTENYANEYVFLPLIGTIIE